MSYLSDIRDFHTRFRQPYKGPGRCLTGDEASFRIKFLHEETNELEAAWKTEKQEEALDAMVDMLYVLLGTVYLCGYRRIFKAAWKRVHIKNMQKVLAKSAAESARGYQYDVIKPPGWTPPDHSDLIDKVTP